jgi:formylglycine-generating enzyme required for sulfatase activity
MHAASRSPFDVDDLAGNLLELVTSSQKPGETVMRGGAYFFNSVTCRSTNRNAVPRTFRDVTTGIRVCGSIAEGS